MRRKCRRPLCGECLAVDDLMTLDAAGRIGPRRAALEMHDGGQRLIENSASRRAHGKREIGILVVSRCITRVEAAKRSKQRAGNRDARARAIVDFAQIVVLGAVRIVVAAEVPRRAITPDDAAGFLQTAVGINKLCTDQSRFGMLGEHVGQRLEPARCDDGVVVQEDENIAAGDLRSAIAAADEAQVRAIALEPDATDVRERAVEPLRRSVVDDDHFILTGRRMRLDALEACKRQERLPIRGDDDRYAGHVDRHECEGSDRLFELELGGSW